METFKFTKVELLIYVATFILVLWCYYCWTIRHFLKLSAKMKMFPARPIIGSSLEFVGSLKRKKRDTFSMLRIIVFFCSHRHL